MSLSHELRILELDTQSELLARLQLLTEFGSNFISVTGKKGAGKSWLAQRYLEAWAQNKNQSLLMCHVSQSDEQRRAMILNQISRNASFIFNQQDPLIDNLVTLLNGAPCNIVIVVDDAQLLSDTLVSELWALVLEAYSNPAWTVSVILFSEQSRFDTILDRLSHGQELKPIDIEIDPLSREEAENFLEKLVVRYSPGEEAKTKIRQTFKKTPPLPGELIALGVPKVEKRIIIRSIIGSPINIIGIIVSSLLLIAAGYWWLFRNPIPDDVSTLREAARQQQMVIPNQPTSISAAITVPKSTSAALSAATTTEVITPDVIEEIEEIEESLKNQSEAIAQLTATIQANTTDIAATNSSAVSVVNVPLVAISSASDSLIKTGTSAVKNNVSATATDKSVANTVTAVSTSTSALTPTTTSNVTTPSTATSTKVTDDVAARKGNTSNVTVGDAAALLAIPANHYTLQIAAMNMATTQEGVLTSFVEKYKNQGALHVYTTIRNGVTWKIVTLNDYSSLQDARDATEQLPNSLKKLTPWAKSMKSVHAEINNK